MKAASSHVSTLTGINSIVASHITPHAPRLTPHASQIPFSAVLTGNDHADTRRVAGSGKSILASQTIHRIQDAHLNTDDSICFAYFNVSNNSFQDSRALILALTNQLCRHQDRVPKWLLQTKKEGRDPLEDATIENFLKLTVSHPRTFVVIDGLDECPDAGRKSVLNFIDAITTAKRVFKVFVTSRRKADVARILDHKRVLQVTTDSQGTTNDINLLIRQRTASLRSNQSLLIQSNILFDHVVATLIQKADGM
jgi:hypothetical protein